MLLQERWGCWGGAGVEILKQRTNMCSDTDGWEGKRVNQDSQLETFWFYLLRSLLSIRNSSKMDTSIAIFIIFH